MKKNIFLAALAVVIGAAVGAQQAMAAIALDRTRVIFDGANRSVSLNISNENKELPYLAQGWIEDINGKKIESPLIVLPPLQRVEPGAKSQVKIQAIPAIGQLPQDRESLYYFNLREIPPKSNKPNTLQVALQTRIKLFYRPKALMATADSYANPWQMKVTLTRMADKYQINNPTPYYVTIAGASSSLKGKDVNGFSPFMIDPKGSASIPGSAAALGSSPVLTYINDFGGRPKLEFQCAGSSCTVKANHPG
ncbi:MULTISPECIES: fimbria/pilus periplasmic chaperone [Edwardsiella]|uniref:Periplasmic fimbrial chaperone StfD n=2 Tax=Edwardsiella anguillarum TaxID=1821960 RepID=A0A076LIP0_9GAMM|nr:MULTISPECIES: fimbria/pilus periplasmic chaperone [Edwardsiella]AKM47454.1 molecular chaperone [Edwardsiella sp. EA181011]AIJ06757.1 Periplasmic fimbrial chaperone StfD [Edwardsiella anguillarum ET080813]AKR78234.1 fimbria/pilus periplasmic chaperone [Edwardsiella sp. LADL05-105]KAB0593364.1 fimbria/pilus periplasmic chaperone [Edwardsiella anguillarum]RFT02339.1 molecular chaperone [Edwardsiella anguillarum]